MSYYIVMTKGGDIYGMNKNCTNVYIDHEKYLNCLGDDKTLLLIPHSEVEVIQLIEED